VNRARSEKTEATDEPARAPVVVEKSDRKVDCAAAGIAVGDGAMETFRQLGAQASPAAQKDFEVVAKAYGESVRTLNEAGVKITDPSTQQSAEAREAVAAADALIEDPAVVAAVESVGRALEEHCPES
jgi:hypothetical protein